MRENIGSFRALGDFESLSWIGCLVTKTHSLNRLTFAKFGLSLGQVGGAVYFDAGSADFTSCVFSDNAADTTTSDTRGGGGIASSYSTVTLTKTVFKNNAGRNVSIM